MENKIRSAIAEYKMLSAGDAVTVGLSGGADSSALVHALAAMREDLGINVYACHVNHNLRGAESDGDEAFVRGLCERLGVQLEVFLIDVPAAAKKHESTEETARKLRYECFSEICEKNGSKLATAHTANDNAETVLMNMIRGTGTKGLAGIPPVRGIFIRPLIYCTREETEEYCRKNGIEFVTDSSNLSDDYTRNRIRHNLLPLLKEFNPSFIAAVSRMTAAVGDDCAFLEQYARECAEKCVHAGGNGYDSRRLAALPAPIRFRIVADELKKNGIEPSALRVSQCFEIIEKGMGKVNLQKNKFALVRKKHFFIADEIQQYRPR